MANLPKIALGAWAWGNDGTFGNNLTVESLKPIFDTAMENGLEEPYVPHPLAGVMAQNKRTDASKKHVWTTGAQKIVGGEK